jgi:hypothetical protein
MEGAASKLCDRLHVVGVVRIAPLDARQRGLGQRGLDLQVAAVGLGLLRALAGSESSC